MPKDTQGALHRYTVGNLNCGGCASRAEAALRDAPGVVSAEVNFALKRADVVLGPDADPSGLISQMAQAGYPITPVQTRRVRAAVGNLTCGGCVARAEAALHDVPGVLQASVNLATKEADLLLAGDSLVPELQSRMDQAGYPLDILDSADDTAAAPEDEAAPMRRAFLMAAALTVPVFVMEMGGHLIPAFHMWQMQTFGTFPLHLVQFLLTSAVLAGPGRVFFELGVPALIRRAPEMNSLVVLGAGAAWVWSTVVTFAPGVVPETGRYVYFEAAAVIVTLILLGRWLEARARGSAGAAIAGLMSLRPETATCVVDGAEVDRPISQIAVGDVLRLRPGDRVAVDGVVIDGETYVDETMLTGEPVPVAKRPDDAVTAGTVNGSGSVLYKATAVGQDTVLARIVAMVEDAQATRLPVQALINRVTAVFVPVVLVIALSAAGLWLALGPDPAKALVIAVSVLIIACPCAMGLATPVSILAGTGRAAELGVLFRRGDALQDLGKVDLVAFDKTGTLTEGRPSVAGVFPAQGVDPARLLALAAGGERASEHPLAKAIVAEAEARGIAPIAVEAFQSETGAGIVARHDGDTLRVGSDRHVTEAGVCIADQGADPAHTRVHVALGDTYLGAIALADALKPDAARTVQALQGQGVRVAMLSGDAEGPVETAAATLGIDTAFARMTPADKQARVEA